MMLREDETSRIAREIPDMIAQMFAAHDQYPKKPGNRVRKTDGAPYGIHPGLPVFLMLHEMGFPLEERLVYAEALNFHDTDEDTFAKVVVRYAETPELVKGLTFEDGLDNAEEAMKRGPKIAMLKSYDSYGNLYGLDKIDWPIEKKKRRIEKAVKLFAFARVHYPDLYLWPVADALVAHLKTKLGI